MISANLAVTKDQIFSDILTQGKTYKDLLRILCKNLLGLGFIPKTYKAYLAVNEYLLNQKQSKSCFEAVQGALAFQNNTKVYDQQNFLIATASRILISSTEISSIGITQSVIRISLTELYMYSVTFTNITTTVGAELLRFTSSSIVLGAGVNYSNSNAMFMIGLYSVFNIDELHISNTQILNELVNLRQISKQATTESGAVVISQISNSLIEASGNHIVK